MFDLQNDTLTVTLLDPVADRERFGTRYCTAGYVFQISDVHHGELLSGPTFPHSFNTFDGQGIPDAFNLSPLRDPQKPGPLALILGIGLCDLEENAVKEFSAWEQKLSPAEGEFRTVHESLGYSVEVVRKVSLLGRTVRSWTSVHNLGKETVPLRWFPHPFYPQPTGTELCAFNLAVSFPVNSGYRMADNGFIHRIDKPVTPGPFQSLNHDAHAPLAVWQRHDKLGLVGARSDYVPAAFPIWGNAHTFSWEPYLERGLFAGDKTAWTMEYLF
jgi:hypothetical protein